MSEAGYTLVETLAALAIVALAVSGLTVGARVVTRQHDAVNALVAEAEALRAAQAALERLLADRGPFRAHLAGDLEGEPQVLRFACEAPQGCSAELVEAPGGQALRVEDGGVARTLPLPAAAPLRFLYRGPLGVGPEWPPQRPERQALESVAIAPAEAARPPLVTARVWSAQPVTCAFDVILQDCR